LLGVVAAVTLAAAGCMQPSGTGDEATVVKDQVDAVALAQSDPAPPPLTVLSAADVTAVTQAAAESLAATTMIIAVVDREGTVLGLYRKGSAPTTVAGNFGVGVNANDHAVSLARTGAFFSNDEAPLSSRTVRFISGIHFPPGIANKPNAELYGIENTNRGCPFVTPGDPAFNITPGLTRPISVNGGTCDTTDASGCGLGIATGKADVNDSVPSAVTGGGVPIFKNGRVVGGIGVTGIDPSSAEYAAFKGSIPSTVFGPQAAAPGVIFIDGIALPFVDNTSPPSGAVTGGTFNAASFVFGPIASPRGEAGVPDGYLIGPVGGSALSLTDVTTIVNQAVAQSLKTRAAIRLPPSRPAKMMIAVSDVDGRILALFRMPDSTIFSIDVAVTKARNVIYFSGANRVASDLPNVPIGTAVTARTISFGAQPLFPPGIDGSGPGPFFNLYKNDVARPCKQGSEPANIHQSGIIFFPGSTPLYRNGALIGGLGVSGDGVAQDDLVAAAGATGYAPAEAIRADQIVIGDVRLPYFKFPQNPELL
jgi:uncharacterized protein GlcG (DUF336 family)